jgi:hypothetical protein
MLIFGASFVAEKINMVNEFGVLGTPWWWAVDGIEPPTSCAATIAAILKNTEGSYGLEIGLGVGLSY